MSDKLQLVVQIDKLKFVGQQTELGEYELKPNHMLTIASLLSMLLLTLHLTDDIVRGYEPGGLNNLIGAALISVVWLYGATVLAERRSGYIILLVGGLLSFGVAVIHMKGKGVAVASRIAHSKGAFFFVWTLIALGVLGLFSVILSLRGLWSLPWRRTR
jgi:hypothetical protein